MLFEKNQPFQILALRRKQRPVFGRLVRGRWLHFDYPLTRYHIALRRARVWLYRLEIIGAGVFALGFLGLAGLQLLKVNSLNFLFTASFWLDASVQVNPIPFYILMSILCFAYLLYRVVSNEKVKGLVETRDYGVSAESQDEMIADPKVLKNLPRSKRKNIAKTFTDEALLALEKAYVTADKYNHKEVTATHIFAAMIESQKVYAVFLRMGISIKNLKARIHKSFQKEKRKEPPVLSEDAYQVIMHAYESAYAARQEYVHVTELLSASVRQSESLQELLYDLAVDGQKLKNVVEWVRVRERMRRQYQKFRRAAARVSKHGMDKAMTAVATPFLNQFSQDLTLAAKFGRLSPCVARDKEIEEIFRIIEGGRQSVVLVGQHGVGKMSIIEGVIQRMIEGNAPQRLLDKRLVQLSTSALLAGATTSGAQERLIRMVSEIQRAGNIILFINNIHDLVSISGGQEGLDVSETLAEYLGGGVVLFATTTPEGYNRHINNSQLGTALNRVDVNEMNEDQAIQVLESKVPGVEYKHNVFFSYDALAQSVKLAKRFLHDQTLPESALGLMAEAASFTRRQKGDNAIVEGEHVAGIVSEKTGVPTTNISENESDKLLRLEDEMHKRVVGQDEAVKLVANALRRARAEVRSTKRPIANFLFLGPTGVGKTELTKTIASVYFGGEDRMIRIDMSEYQDRSGIYRLIGQPGQQGTGLLTEAVRQQPFSLVLLDEMEKADPNILNLFLQVFDDGRLTDSVGRVIDFTNTIIIATSNAGTRYVQEQLAAGVPLEDIRQTLIRGELKQYYRPEFLNRFDGIVLFRSLKRKEIKKIAGLMLNRVAADLQKRGVALKVENAALETLADAGFDPEFGARPMRRAIQEHVEDKLAELILSDKLRRRDTVVLGKGAEIRIEPPA